MKNTVKITIVSLLLIQALKAQNTFNKSIHKGEMSITPCFGFPNFLTTVLKNSYELTNHKKEQLRIAGFGPIGISASYLVNDHLAIGGEISYASAVMQWQETVIATDSITNHTYRFLFQAQQIRALVILNYYLVMREHYNWYLGFGLGYKYTPIKLDADASLVKDYELLSPCFLPFSVRTKLGFNYYFSKNIAVTMEAGIGGPLLSAGITVKF